MEHRLKLPVTDGGAGNLNWADLYAEGVKTRPTIRDGQ